METQQYHFETFIDVKGDYRWRAVAQNGKVIATSGGDGYKNKADCIGELRVVVAYAQTAPWFHKEVNGQLTHIS